MKLNIKSLLSAGALATSLCSMAQNSESAYFLDDYTYRFQSNPAYANNHGFFSFPSLGNMSIGLNGSLGVQDIFYNVNGKTTTFLNPGVSTAEAMKRLGSDKRFALDLRETLLAFGFKGFGGYNTFSLGVRSTAEFKLPSSIFSLMKEGLSNDTYHIANFKGRAHAFAEIALNHSREILPGLRAGVTLKGLVGAGNANIDLQEADLVLGYDNWEVRSRGEINVNLQGFKFKQGFNDKNNQYYVNGVDQEFDGIAGIGAAIDLGATWRPQLDIPVLKDFEFSAAILDLGFINWKSNYLASTNGTKTFSLNKYAFDVDDMQAEWDNIESDISRLYQLEDMGDQGSVTKALGATINLGAQYHIPYVKVLRVGLLNTTHLAGNFTWNDTRLSLNLVPCKFIDMSVSTHTGTYGTGFGGIINFTLPGVNLFFACDDVPTKFTKDFIPMTSSANFNFGLNFLF